MPIYEYRCHTCGKTITVIQGIKEDRLKIHEGCGGELERLISGGRLLLTERKGSAAESDEFPDMPPMGGDFGGEDFGEDDFGGDDNLGAGDFDAGEDENL